MAFRVIRTLPATLKTCYSLIGNILSLHKVTPMVLRTSLPHPTRKRAPIYDQKEGKLVHVTVNLDFANQIKAP